MPRDLRVEATNLPSQSAMLTALPKEEPFALLINPSLPLRGRCDREGERRFTLFNYTPRNLFMSLQPGSI